MADVANIREHERLIRGLEEVLSIHEDSFSRRELENVQSTMDWHKQVVHKLRTEQPLAS